MLQVGMQVVYGIHGVCNIDRVEIRSVDRKKVEYFVLVPVDQPGASFYVPTQNAAALSKLRPLLTPQELEGLISSPDAHQDCWVQDENQRKLRYRELISSGDRAALISMIRALLLHKQRQQAAGRKFHLCDENFLRDARKLLISEFSLVLGLSPADAGTYIDEKISQ